MSGVLNYGSNGFINHLTASTNARQVSKKESTLSAFICTSKEYEQTIDEVGAKGDTKMGFADDVVLNDKFTAIFALIYGLETFYTGRHVRFIERFS